jgi:hypothetical protein
MATATQQQRQTAQHSQLERAIERAMKLGVEVCGKGHLRGSNDRIYLVPSQRDPERHWHIVRVAGNRLICDCQSRVVCCHQAAVHMHLIVAAAEKEARAAELGEQLERERSEASADRADEPMRAWLNGGEW